MSLEAERHSQALEVALITDPVERAQREARNTLQQFAEVIDQIEHWLRTGRQFKLRPSAILSLNRKALDGISGYAGVFRPAGIAIKGSKHEPPGAHLVPELVEYMCDYVNDNWDKSPLHLAAFVMWRMNWVHPFVDGNGRTARAVSYLVFSVRLGHRLPGTRTIPEQIAENKTPYYEALEAADQADGEGRIDVSKMEAVLEDLLGKQLVHIYEAARSDAVRPPGIPNP